MEYDFESKGEDKEDLSPKSRSWTGVRNGGKTEEDQSSKYGSWTKVLTTGVGLESKMEMERRRTGVPNGVEPEVYRNPIRVTNKK